MVSHRAPVEVEPDGGGGRMKRTVGGLATALTDALRAPGGTWVAWAGEAAPDVLVPDATGLSFPIRAVPLDRHEIDNYYAGFANQVLWPLCHIFPDRCHFRPAFWESYQHANERFAGAVRAEVRRGDLVWVNDFHLCLVPGLLRASAVPARLGIFWHIPFPPPAVFGICRWRAELLAGLLGADVIGLQTAADARNFAACVRQFLELPILDDPLRVRLPGRDVHLLVLPVGVDAARFRAQAADPAIREQAARVRANLGTDLVCLGVDRLDYTKGIIERLLGFEAFLERHPSWRGRVGLLQITVPSRFRVPDYRDMKRTIDETVGRIVGRFTHEGRAPLAYLYTAFDHEELAAYYVAADVALVTPLRDGMNLVAKEYVACHAGGDGVLVLSEFAGAADELREALLVNPWDAQTIRRQIDLAVTMTDGERRRRMGALAARVCARDVRWWAAAFLAALADGADASPEARHDDLELPGLA
ncbi:MAG TPA: trehalose-6-phosphate synthase [Candidatus Binatia bacterium]|nr:trehalose-6-phosphate synthase [Candidatus Binatia bacterium]